MQRMNIRMAVALIVGCLLIAADATAQQGFRTNQLLLDDNATALGDRNTITLLSPATGTLTADYALRLPDQTNMAAGAMLFAGSATASSADLGWLSPGADLQVLQMNGTSGLPEWQTIQLIPDGTVDNSTLRWDATSGSWMENTNLTSTTDGNTIVGGTMQIDGATTTINSATVTAPNVPAGVDGDINIVLRDGTDNLVVRTINDLIGDATLSQNAIWVGDAANNPEERAAGTTDQVLQIAADGSPQWQTIELIPTGTTDNSTLRWDNTNSVWVENTNLLSDTDGNTTINGATITTPNVPVGAANDTNVVLRNASNNLVIRSINDLLDDATLSQNAIWVGDASNNPEERAAGTTDQVLQIAADGSPQWQTIQLIPDGTVESSTLRWDNTNGVWVENVNLLSDADGSTTINGANIVAPNIPGTSDAGEIGVVIRHSTDNNLEVRTINDLIGDATLTENSIWVGDASNNPEERAAGTTDQVLQIAADGSPQWQTIQLIPDGTVDNTTLRWDATSGTWQENTNLTSDPSGNTVVGGTMQIDGATTTINSATVTAPNVPAGVDGDIDIVLRDGSDNLVVRTINDLIGDATLSQNAIWVGDASNNPEERAAGATDQVLQIAADGSPQWQDINLIPDGTTNNSTLRWNAATSTWQENTNLLSDTDGNTTINGTDIVAPNIPGTSDAGQIDVVVRHDTDNNLEVRTINDLIGDATLTQNSIWVGDASNNPEERAAGTTDQVLQIAADGSPQWQDINLVHQGRVATGGTLTQTINATQVTATATINVQYEDPSNGARIAIDVIGRNAGTSFNVGFSALPPAGTFVNYTIVP